MDISTLVSTEFPTVGPDARVSELRGTFREAETKAVLVVDDGGAYRGVVTVRQLNNAHLDPDTKARSLLWHPARVAPDEDVRTVARLLVASRSEVLPVFADDAFVGVVTADAVIAAVEEFLGVLDVSDVSSEGLVTLPVDATFGDALNAFREHRITHLPVVDGDDVAGVVSLSDVLEFTTAPSTSRPAAPPAGTTSPAATPPPGSGRPVGWANARANSGGCSTCPSPT